MAAWWFQTLNWDDDIPNIRKVMFQTTNQIFFANMHREKHRFADFTRQNNALASGVSPWLPIVPSSTSNLELNKLKERQ